jgi:hypothetical protein
LKAKAPDLKRRQRRYAPGRTHVLFVPFPGRRLVGCALGKRTVRVQDAGCNRLLLTACSRLSRGYLTQRPKYCGSIAIFGL